MQAAVVHHQWQQVDHKHADSRWWLQLPASLAPSFKIVLRSTDVGSCRQLHAGGQRGHQCGHEVQRARLLQPGACEHMQQTGEVQFQEQAVQCSTLVGYAAHWCIGGLRRPHCSAACVVHCVSAMHAGLRQHAASPYACHHTQPDICSICVAHAMPLTASQNPSRCHLQVLRYKAPSLPHVD